MDNKIFRFIFLSIFLLIYINMLYSQNNQDCVGAIAVCQSTYYQENSYSGVGSVNDIPSGLSCPTTCMSAGERNSVWYTFQVQTAGWIDFRIQPIGSDDYDWALFNLATHSCSDLTNTTLLPSMEVSCNWSSETGTQTGANGLSNNTGVDCADASAVPNNPRVWGNVGEIYYLNVSNYSSSSDGYNLNFTNSTATIFDVTPPSFTGINTNIACGSTTITVYFSENVLCSSVNPADFNIVSADGTTHTVTSISGQACSQGGSSENEYVLTVTPAITSGGTYTISLVGPISDACGNVANTASFEFFINQVFCSVVNTVNPDCGVNNGAITVVGNSGSGSYTYTWNTTPVQTGASATGLGAGSYTVTVQDGACHSECNVTLTSGNPPTIATSTTPATCGANNGTATATPTGAPPYTYTWSTTPAQTDSIATGLAPGSYTVTVNDANSCPATASVTISASASPQISNIAVVNAKCTDDNGSLTVNVTNGSTPYTYSWSTTPVQTGQTASNLPAGSYTVTVSDANSCTTTSSATVVFQPGPSITDQDITHSTCGSANGTITIYTNSGTAPLTTTWSTTPPQSGNTASNLLPGSYTVTVSDANSCTATATYTINDNPGPQITSPIIVDALCGANNGSIQITVTGGTAPVTQAWSTSPVQTGTSITDLAPGSYTVTVTDGNSCTITQSFSVINVAGPTISNSSIQNATCSQSNGSISIVVNSTGSLTYAWSTTPTQTSQNLSNIPAGSYTVTVTDENNCTVTASFNVQNISGPSITNTSRQHATCGQSNGRASITVSGGTAPISYSWNTTPPQSTATATGLAQGTYIVTVTDGTGCTITSSFTIQDLAGPQITQIIKTDETCTGMNGSATVQYSGGNGIISITWSTVPPQTTATINNLASGTYNVTIRDTNNCTATSSVTIVNFPSPTIDGFTAQDELCDEQNGSIQVNYTGGTPPISFAWNTVPVQHNQTATNLIGGSYSVTITDVHNCTVQATWTIINHPKPTSLFSNIVMDTCIVGSGKVTAFAEGGSGVYSYIWNTEPAQNTESATGLFPGMYAVSISDGYCTIVDSILIIGIPGPNADFSLTPPLATLSNATIRFTDLTEPEIVSWKWHFGDGFTDNVQNPVHIYQNTGNYEVFMVVMDNHGCIDTAWGSVIIDVDFGIWIPNAFTPNEDGKNDRFGPRAVGFLERDYEMKIYDRWGQMVFETHDYYQQWDGTIKGSDIENNVIATYVYRIVIYDNLNKRHVLVGKLSLIY